MICQPVYFTEEIELLEEDHIDDDPDYRAWSLSSASASSPPEPLPSSSRYSSPPEPLSSPPSSPRESVPASARKEKKINFQQAILKKFDKLEEDAAKQHEHLKEVDQKMLEFEVKKTELLETFVKDTKELKDAFISFLNSNM